MRTISFLRGVGTGAAAGMAIGMIVSSRNNSMHTGIGRAMERASSVMDNAIYGFWRTMQ